MDEQASFLKIAELFQNPISLDADRPASRKQKGADPSASEELARQSLTDGDYEGAIQHFKRASEQRETDTAGQMVDLAGAFDAADLAPQAKRQYEKALRVQRDAPDAHLGLADLYRRYGRFRDALEAIRQTIEVEPENPYYRMKLAETLREMGEPTRALAAAQEAVAIKPDEAFYHYWVGDLLIQLGRFSEALESLRAAIELSPGDDFLYLRASVAFWGAGKKPEAIKAVRLASELDPAKHVYYGLLELLLLESGMAEEAKLEREQAAKMDRFDRDALQRVAREMGIAYDGDSASG